MEFFSERLLEYGEQGYQIVFDEHGIRVWYRFSYEAPKLYEGSKLEDALEIIAQHSYNNGSDKYKGFK